MSRGGMWIKMAGVFTVCCVGGPALMYYVTPSEGELFKQFSPELQKRNLELRDERKKNYEDFVGKLKEYSKSDKPIWDVAAEADRKSREMLLQQQAQERELQRKMRDEMRAEASASR